MPKKVDGSYNWHRLLDSLIGANGVRRDELAKAAGLVDPEGRIKRQQLYRAVHSPRLQGLCHSKLDTVGLNVDWSSARRIYDIYLKRGGEHEARLLRSDYFARLLDGPMRIHLASSLGFGTDAPAVQLLLDLCASSPTAVARVLRPARAIRGDAVAGEELHDKETKKESGARFDYLVAFREPSYDSQEGILTAHRDRQVVAIVEAYLSDLRRGRLVRNPTTPIRTETTYTFGTKQGFKVMRTTFESTRQDGRPVLLERPSLDVARFIAKLAEPVVPSGPPKARRIRKRRKAPGRGKTTLNQAPSRARRRAR